MVLSRETFENLLTEAIATKSDHQFAYILMDLRIDPDQKLQSFGNLSTFEKVLSVPGSQRFIELCIQRGSNFYQKNSNEFYPLQYAVESLCADNLKVLLHAFDGSITQFEDRFAAVRHSSIVNERFQGGNNYLHFLVDKLSEENLVNVSGMIKLLVNYKCNLHQRNDQHETPFGLLVQKTKSLNLDNDLISFISTNVCALQPNESDEITDILVERGFEFRFSKKKEEVKDFGFMMKSIEQFDEKTFIAEFMNFKTHSQSYQSESSRLLEAAIVRNLIEVVTVLFTNEVCVHGSPYDSEYKLMPAFLACFFGHHHILKVLLSESTLKFTCEKTQQNLLHQICSTLTTSTKDRKKCFGLIIADPRCTREMINSFDASCHTPLFYTCQNGFEEITKELLRRGAYIGHESIIEIIDKNVLNEFLDECVKTSSDVRDKSCEIYVDYRFLIDQQENHSEVLPVYLMADSQVKDLILHPVISSFLLFKWKRVNFLVYLHLLIYFCFMLYLGIFINDFFHSCIFHESDTSTGIYSRSNFNETSFQSATPFFNMTMEDSLDDPFKSDGPFPASIKPEKPSILSFLFGLDSSQSKDTKRSKRSADEMVDEGVTEFESLFYQNAFRYRICFFGVLFMALYEIVQCVMSFKKYFFKVSNWLDIILLSLAFTVLIATFEIDPQNYKRIRAITILVIAAQTIQLISKVSFMSMSLHMAIFKRVCVTFMKTLGLYLILILAFAMSFYTLDENSPSNESDDKEKSFSNPFMSIITVVRMMLSDFDTVDLDDQDPFRGAIFLLFVLLITVVLFNLLTALAISDTHEIMKGAELVDATKRITILSGFEKILKFFRLSFANIFPEMSTIMFKPNKDCIVRVKRIVNTDKPDEVKIFVKNSGKIRDSINLYATKLKFWKKSKTEVKLNSQVVEKFIAIAKAQREVICNEF